MVVSLNWGDHHTDPKKITILIIGTAKRYTLFWELPICPLTVGTYALIEGRRMV